MAASKAVFISGINVGMAIGASGKEIIVSGIEYGAAVVAPTPTSFFASGGAALL